MTSTYRYFGGGDEVLLCLNGGPGLPCDYRSSSTAHSADLRRIGRWRWISWAVAVPTNHQTASLWTIERYVGGNRLRAQHGTGPGASARAFLGGWLALNMASPIRSI